MTEQSSWPFRLTTIAWGLSSLAMCSAVLLSSTMFQDYPLVLDEHGSYWLLESDIPSGVYQRSLDYAAIPPLSSWTQKLSTAVFGKSEIAFRLPSMLAFCAGVAVLIACGWKNVDPVTGSLAGLLLAWNPVALNEIRIARCYGLIVFFAACLLWITIVWWKDRNNWQWALSFAALTVLLGWTHYLAVLFACLCGAALVVLPRKRLADDVATRRPKAALISLVVMVSGLLCLPLLPALERLRNWSTLMELQSQSPSLFDVTGPVWSVGVPAGLVAAWLLGRYLHSGQNLMGARNRSTFAISAFVAVGSLVVFLTFAFTGPESVAANPRYQVAFATALSLTMAVAIRNLTSKTNRPELAALCAASVMIIAGWLTAGKSPLVPDRLASTAAPEWRDAAVAVANRSARQDLIFVQSGLVEAALVPELFHDDLFMEYVACRMGKFYLDPPRERIALPFFWKGYIELASHCRGKLRNLRSSGGSVWVAAATDTDPTLASLIGFRSLLAAEGWTLTSSLPQSQMTLEQYRYDRPAGDGTAAAPSNRPVNHSGSVTGQ